MVHLTKKSGTRTRKTNLTTGILALLRRKDEMPDFRHIPLGLESLESRSLMAVAAMGSDMQAAMPADSSALAAMQTQPMPHGPMHNSQDPEDVDNDGSCTASDVISIVNAINAKSTNASSKFLDVDSDGQCTASDVM